jgi:RNA polymerase sigma factor (sigma-70 family)
MHEGEAEEVHFPVDELTDRERQVFQMLGQGLSVEAIADRLDLTRKTVETHRRRTKEKLGYETIDEVVSHAARWVLGAKSGDEKS